MFFVLLLSLVASLTVSGEMSNNLHCGTEDDQLYIYRVPKHSCSCSPKTDGELRYHNKKLQICDGEKFVDVGSGGFDTRPTTKPTPAATPAPTLPPEVGTEKNPGSSCSHIASSRSDARDGYYYLKTGGRVSSVYCYMGYICGSRGWVMIMKINGRSGVFNYDSSYWSNKVAYNPSGAASGLGQQETKLDTYWTYPFNRLCLGMNAGGTRWLTVNYHGTSLYNVIAPGGYRGFHVGRQTWKNLIPNSSLQRNCNREGFNVAGHYRHSKARIGIISNQENECTHPDSRIGFGTGGGTCGENNSNSAGNEARCDSDNGNRSIYGFGYIFAQQKLF